MHKTEATAGQIAVGATAVGAILLTIGLTAYPGWAAVGRALWQEQAAAWAQALLSVAAIAVGFVFIEKQIYAARKLEADKRHLDDLKVTEVIDQLFRNARDAVENAHVALMEELLVDFSPVWEDLETCARALEVLPALEIPGTGLAVAVSKVPNRVRRYRAIASRYQEETAQLNLERLKHGVPKGAAQIPGRTRMYYQLLHKEAVDHCAAAVATSEAQTASLRELAGITD
jgi:hypothetical protein